MLGVKSNRNPIKGQFAEKLREQIAVVQARRASSQTEVKTQTSSQEQKK